MLHLLCWDACCLHTCIVLNYQGCCVIIDASAPVVSCLKTILSTEVSVMQVNMHKADKELVEVANRWEEIKKGTSQVASPMLEMKSCKYVI